jgi:hypothetical protein
VPLDCSCGLLATIRCTRCGRAVCNQHTGSPLPGRRDLCVYCHDALVAEQSAAARRYEAARAAALERWRATDLFAERAPRAPLVVLRARNARGRVVPLGRGRLIVCHVAREPGEPARVTGWVLADDGTIVSGAVSGNPASGDGAVTVLGAFGRFTARPRVEPADPEDAATALAEALADRDIDHLRPARRDMYASHYYLP